MDFSCFAFVDFVDKLVGYQQAQVIPFLPILSISFSCSIALPGAFNFLSLCYVASVFKSTDPFFCYFCHEHSMNISLEKAAVEVRIKPESCTCWADSIASPAPLLPYSALQLCRVHLDSIKFLIFSNCGEIHTWSLPPQPADVQSPVTLRAFTSPCYSHHLSPEFTLALQHGVDCIMLHRRGGQSPWLCLWCWKGWGLHH